MKRQTESCGCPKWPHGLNCVTAAGETPALFGIKTHNDGNTVVTACALYTLKQLWVVSRTKNRLSISVYISMSTRQEIYDHFYIFPEICL